VVEGARLESDFGEADRGTPKHLEAQIGATISRVTVLLDVTP
jgi:hypothetical protein